MKTENRMDIITRICRLKAAIIESGNILREKFTHVRRNDCDSEL